MTIQVRLFASLAQQASKRLRASGCLSENRDVRAGQSLQIELPGGSCVADLLQQIELPVDEVKVVFVNARARKFDHPLAEGDQVGIFPLVGGG